MAITRDKLLRESRKTLNALKDLENQSSLPYDAPVMQLARKAIEDMEELIGEEV